MCVLNQYFGVGVKMGTLCVSNVKYYVTMSKLKKKFVGRFLLFYQHLLPQAHAKATIAVLN